MTRQKTLTLVGALDPLTTLDRLTEIAVAVFACHLKHRRVLRRLRHQLAVPASSAGRSQPGGAVVMNPPDRQGRRCCAPPEAHRRSCRPSGKRPLLCYLRVRPDTPDVRIEVLRRTMAAFASLEGFVITRVLVDRHFEHTSAFAELLAALDEGEASHVLVPALHHFGHAEGVQLVMKELLESRSGARVLVLFPELRTGAAP